MIFNREHFLVCDGSRGYIFGHCSLCGASGWLDNIKHTSDCLLADESVDCILVEAFESEESVSECHREGDNGNCGPGCPMFLRGDCPVADEMCGKSEVGIDEGND